MDGFEFEEWIFIYKRGSASMPSGLDSVEYGKLYKNLNIQSIVIFGKIFDFNIYHYI